MNNFEQEKKKLTDALSKPIKVSSDINKANQELKKHIGFEEEKDTFRGYMRVYALTQGRF
jgi:hypothetical protein